MDVAVGKPQKHYTSRKVNDEGERTTPQQEASPPQFMHMAMAMVALSGTYHSISLQPQTLSRRFSCSAAHLPRQNVFEICTSVPKIRAWVGDCYRTIAWSRRKRRGDELWSLRDASKSLRRRKCCAMGAYGEIMEGDVVEYPLPEDVRQGGLYSDRSYGLGAVHELVSDNSSSSLMCHIEPLVMNEPPKPTWIVDERQDMVVVPLTEVRRLEAWLSMRMVDDRISNPHGEHAEHLWLVEEPLSESSGSPMYDQAPSNHE